MPALDALKECLGAAAQIKSALLKARPSRQEWEQAPPFFRCTVAGTEAVLQARKQDFPAQYGAALRLKEEGNDLIDKDPAAALELYAQALSVFTWFDRGPDRASEDVPLTCSADTLPEGQREQAHQLLATCFSNAAACLLRLSQPDDATYACSKALQYDPYHVKALYRRALARHAAGTSAGLAAAVEDLAAANRLEPANGHVRTALARMQHELRELRRKERDMYGNMFEGRVLYGEAAAGAGGAEVAGGRPGPAGGGTQAAAAAAGAEDEADAGPEGRDPEDLLSLDPKRRKAQAAAAAREADAVLRRMRRSLGAARSRQAARAMGAARRGAAGAGDRAAGALQRGGLAALAALPWWAYALIGLHLLYRVVKLWRLPLPTDHSTQQQLGAAAAAHPEL